MDETLFDGCFYTSRKDLIAAICERYSPGHEFDAPEEVARQWAEDSDFDLAARAHDALVLEDPDAAEQVTRLQLAGGFARIRPSLATLNGGK